MLKELKNELKEFIHSDYAPGSLMILTTGLALVWVNSSFGDSYEALRKLEFELVLGGLNLKKDLLHWINEGLMSFFFFAAGLEIKRELAYGELASKKKAMFPLIAALCGMLFPALLYLIFNLGSGSLRGWGIPIATDIAFALSVLAFVKSAPSSLRAFLISLAIVDDILAVMVIAVFYSQSIQWMGLVYLSATCTGLYAAYTFKVKNPLFYSFMGILVWGALNYLGVHAALSGVVLALFIPIKSSRSSENFLKKSSSPLIRFEEGVHLFSYTMVLPIFAFFNGGVRFSNADFSTFFQPMSLGIAVGLVVGKPVGIMVASYTARKISWIKIPSDLNFIHLAGVGCLTGIGFTMSFLIANVAVTDEKVLTAARTAILISSILSGLLGVTILSFFSKSSEKS